MHKNIFLLRKEYPIHAGDAVITIVCFQQFKYIIITIIIIIIVVSVVIKYKDYLNLFATTDLFKIWNILQRIRTIDLLCGPVVRYPGYIPRDPGFDSQRYQIFLSSSGSRMEST
jgi:hypothetical protein